MSTMKITLLGIERFLEPDRSVFERLDIPEGIDKNTLISAIFFRCQEFELLYSDPYFMVDAVYYWSRKNYRTFEKWVKALNIEYDPLFNYDRSEEYTDTHSGNFSKNGSGNNSGSNTQTNNLTRTDNLANSSNVTNTHGTKAYNDPAFVDNERDVSNQTGTNTGTVTDTGTVSDQYSNTGSNSESGTDGYTNIHRARLFGNIGVTTSQQMLQSELDIARWNMYEHIADLFCNEFCIMVY